VARARHGFDPGEQTPGGVGVAFAHRALGPNHSPIGLDELVDPALGSADVEAALLRAAWLLGRDHLGAGIQSALPLDAHALSGGLRRGGALATGDRSIGRHASPGVASIVPGAVALDPTAVTESSGTRARARRRGSRPGSLGCRRRRCARRRGPTRKRGPARACRRLGRRVARCLGTGGWVGGARDRRDNCLAVAAPPYGEHATKNGPPDHDRLHCWSAQHEGRRDNKRVSGHRPGAAGWDHSTHGVSGATLGAP